MIPNDSFDSEGIQIHHKKGRIGHLLWNTKYFLAVCPNCHRYIEDHPEQARSNGWSLSRLSKEDQE
jgi:hypothetical protein